MALGNVESGGNAKRATCLAAAVTANVAAPTLPTDGVENYPDPVRSVYGGSDRGVNYSANPNNATTIAIDVSGTTPTAIVTLYGYLAAAGKWYPIKALNAGAAITANYVEVVQFAPGMFDRLALGFASVGGTTPSFNAWAMVPRTIAY